MNPPAWFRDNIAAASVTGVTGETAHDGVLLRWYRWGPAEGPPLVLVHGAAANHAWWSPIAPLLVDAGPVVAVELSGMGDSGWREHGYTIEQWADEITAVVDAACPYAGTGGGSVLVGHSLGAAVAAAAAVRQPQRWARVVLCDLGLAPSRGRTSQSAARAGRAERVGRHFTNRILYRSKGEALAHFSLVPRQRCPNPWMIEHVAGHSIRPVGPGGVGDPSRPPVGEEVGWTWKFDWRLFARTSDRPLADYLAELGRMAGNFAPGPPVVCLNGSLSRVATAAVSSRVAELTVPIRTVWVADAAHHLMLDQPLSFADALRDCASIPLGS